MKHYRKFLIAAILLLLAGWAGMSVWRSDWLAGQIRARAVAEIEKATGAKVRFGEFKWDWARGRVLVSEFVLRGREAATEPPLVKVQLAEVQFKILSFLSPDVDLKAVKLTKPEVYVVTYADGSTNLPRRARPRTPEQVLEQLLNLGIDRLDAEQGRFVWNHEEIPFEFHGEEMGVRLALEGKGYRGNVKGERLALKLPEIRNLQFNAAAEIVLEADHVRFTSLEASLGGLTLKAKGELRNWLHPVLKARVAAQGPVRELVNQFDLPLSGEGTAEAEGDLRYEEGWTFAGTAAGKNVGYRDERIRASGVNVSAAMQYRYTRPGGHELTARRIRADSHQGSFWGSGEWKNGGFRLRGTVGNLLFDDAQHYFDPALPSWGSLVSGPIDLARERDQVRLTARLALNPTDGDRPLSGVVNLAYDSQKDDVQLTATHLHSNSTQVDVEGHLLGGLDVDVTTSNLAELPFVNRLPVRIENGGLMIFRGLVSGGLTEPSAKGHLTAKAITYQGETIDRARTQLEARASRIKFEQLEAFRGQQVVTGTLEVSLFDWQTREESQLRGRLAAQKIEARPYFEEAGGQVQGTAELGGTLREPRLEGNVEWTDAAYQAQLLGTVSGRVSYTNEQIEIRNGRMTVDRQPVEFSGTYVHEPNDLRSGAFQGNAKASGVSLERVPAWRGRFPLWSGRVDVDARARGRVTNGEPDFNLLEGRAVIQQAAYDGKALGALTVHAKTEAGEVRLTGNGFLRGAALTLTSRWKLAGAMPGEGNFELKGAKFDDFQGLVASQGDEWPFDLRLEASGDFRGNLRQAESLKGAVRISQLAMVPRQAISETARRDFTLRSDGPIEVRFDGGGFTVQQGRLLAKDTRLTAAGAVSMKGAASANVQITGEANLAVLSALKADLIAAGSSTLDVTLRGSLSEPTMAGRMNLRDASFFLRDVPNGLAKVNGTVFFDRARARLENLTAQSGGGTIRLGGFIGFSGELSYQLQAQADNVRVRYPDGVSTAINSSLTLAGSASRSLLSGSVTLLRAALNPRTDLGAMIADSAKATGGPPRIENEFLRNMQFDVRVDTALNAQVTTSLTQNVEAEVNLRLRGTPARPVLLGRTSFTQGEISFFGTKYTIDRGEVNFYNQTKVEPVINLDLQTRVRGVVVTINFSGPASKLNLSYRSDPPLQSSEILALLTVGRTPNGSVASGANVQSPTFLQGASSALLGQAVAAPITGRLQRLFGVSRVRIDPQLTGIENTAQARLTIEQQVSRDITVTFITNLNRTQQQIVSVEWDFSREFSALAIRDENGVFGLDFFYRKRFK